MRIELGKINLSWGKQGENNAVELAVDVSAWKAEYPSGAPSAAYTRADGLNYVLPVVMDGNYAVCTLSRTETACAGVVRLQISWIQGELVAKTALFEGYIELGIVDDEEELDSPEETVLEQMQQYAAATAASASAAASSASAAQAAQTEAEAAQDAAENAKSAAETAQGKAEAAQTAAETAQSNAETARTQAQAAQNAAETAQGKAEDAQEAAETARDAAQSAQSAAESAKSGAEAAKSGAETAKTAAETAAGNASDHAEAAASSASAAAQSAQAAQEAAQTALGIIDDEAVAVDSTWSSKQIIDALCPPLEETGNPVQCYPVAGYPLGVKASWEPRQEGTGDPSPENVRPITGLDEVHVAHCGRNLYDADALRMIYNSGETYGFGVPADNLVIGKTYTMSVNAPVFSFKISNYKSGYDSASANNVTDGKFTFVMARNSNIENGKTQYVIVSTSSNINDLVSSPEQAKSLQISICEGDEPMPYAPYTGTTATLSLPSTVYGGEVDAATGEGVETWGRYEFTGNEGFSINAQIQQNSQKNAYQCSINVPNAFYTNAQAICNAFAFQIWNGYFIANSFSLINNSGGIIIQTDGIQSVEEFIAFLGAQHSAGTPVTIVYKLATPQPIQATGSQSLPALSGQNVLITNADSLTVTGRADPNHTIQTLSDRIAALESETIEGGTIA